MHPCSPGHLKVLSKTYAVTNDGTLVATEAQVKIVADAVTAAQSKANAAEGKITALETWQNGLNASNFGITGAWTCPTPSMPS